MNDTIIIKVTFIESLAIRTGLSNSQRDIQRDIDKVLWNQANNVPLILEDFSYPMQLEYYTGRLQKVVDLYERVDTLIDENINGILLAD